MSIGMNTYRTCRLSLKHQVHQASGRCWCCADTRKRKSQLKNADARSILFAYLQSYLFGNVVVFIIHIDRALADTLTTYTI